MNIRLYASAAALVVDLTFGVTALAGGSSPVRYVTGLLFAFFVVGWSLVSHLRLNSVSVALSLTIGIGLVTILLPAEVMILASSWHPVTIESTLIVASALLLVASIVRERSGRAS